ncbi:MAG TPA: hypothetical protein VOA87_05115 [Thermoanaerobaculia bacterium]|nr:hypothetical protein [Thermoanaerobaculia bacterium]
MPMPGALRQRAIYPLIDGDGSCSLIYDLERAAVLGVPEELQFYVAPALETGDLDDDLLSWLVDEDLITSERWGGGDTREAAPPLGESWGPGAICRRGSEIHARVDLATEESAAEAVEAVFKQGLGAPRITLHLSWEGRFPGASLLRRIIAEAGRWAAGARQQVQFELALDAWEAAPEVAAFLGEHPFVHVRLQCGSFPLRPILEGAGPAGEPSDSPEPASVPSDLRVWERTEQGVRALAGVADQVTAQVVLAVGVRLLDLWKWATETGVRHLDVVPLQARAESGWAPGIEPHAYRGDLQAVQEEICAALSSHQLPIEFEPLTRIVRRLMRSEPLTERSLDSGPAYELGAVLPFATAANWDGAEPDMWLGLEDSEPADSVLFGGERAQGFPCAGCWARRICSHSLLAAAPLDAADRRAPSEARCSAWKTEAETALRLYHRLAHLDPSLVLEFFERCSEAAFFGRRGDVTQQRNAF